jgi:iron complex transport system permease protein
MPPSARPPLTLSRALRATALLSLVLLAALALAASTGASAASPWDLLFGGARSGADPEARAVERTILLRVRLPRVLLAAVVGGALTSAGIVFQALLRNPLADPYVLGVSGGAIVGAVSALALGAGGLLAGTPLEGAAVPACAFAGALLALLAVARAATIGGELSVPALLLAGVVFNATSGAFLFFVQSVAAPDRLHEIVFYLMGAVPSLRPSTVGAAAAVAAACVGALLLLARDLNVLSLGDGVARQLGVDIERVRRRAIALGALLTAIAVSVAGPIGFVGLIVPHILRALLGPDHRLLLVAGFLGGGAFLALADAVARRAAAPGEVPVGVVTALLGGPAFLVLLRRARGGHGRV